MAKLKAPTWDSLASLAKIMGGAPVHPRSLMGSWLCAGQSRKIGKTFVRERAKKTFNTKWVRIRVWVLVRAFDLLVAVGMLKDFLLI